MWNIEYSSSNAYFDYMYISIKSVIDNNPNREICFHIFYNDLSNENMRKLEEYLLNKGNKVKYYNIFDYEELITPIFSHGLRLAYVKIAMSMIIQEDMVLHLGADTIVRGGLDELFSVDLTNYYIAGVQDTMCWHDRKKIELSKEDYYVCSDVTLHNLKKQREDNCYNRFIECLTHFGGKVAYCEQGMMNYVFRKKTHILPIKYCVMPPALSYTSAQIKKMYSLLWYYEQSELDEIISTAIIVHFTNGYYGKPWYEDCQNPFTEDFMKYSVDDSVITRKKGNGLSKNAKLMKALNDNLPFSVYFCVFRTLDLYRRIKNKTR